MAVDYLERKRRQKKEQAERRTLLIGGFGLLALVVFLAGGALRMYQDSHRLDRTFQGTGRLNTESFGADADWLIEWERTEGTRNPEIPIPTVFAVSVYREGARDLNDELDSATGPFGPQSGSYRVKHSGRFYLGVIGGPGVKWTVRVRAAD